MRSCSGRRWTPFSLKEDRLHQAEHRTTPCEIDAKARNACTQLTPRTARSIPNPHLLPNLNLQQITDQRRAFLVRHRLRRPPRQEPVRPERFVLVQSRRFLEEL